LGPQSSHSATNGPKNNSYGKKQRESTELTTQHLPTPQQKREEIN